MTITSGPPQAIETHYKGCRFRSRLEARWAVFFDALDIEWTYEVQGYLIGPKQVPYLPDFWLPGLRLWVEVKGVLTKEDYNTLVSACRTDGLPASPEDQYWSNRGDINWAPRLLLLGSIPQPSDFAWFHRRFDLLGDTPSGQPNKKAFIWSHRAAFVPLAYTSWDGRPLVDAQPALDPHWENECPIRGDMPAGLLKLYTEPSQIGEVYLQHPLVKDAYRAARSARFEHGEKG